MRDIITKLEQLNVEKEQLNEGLADMAHEAEKDHEVQMARSDCYKSAKYAVAIHKMLKDVSEMEGIDGWVAAKITKAADYLGSVKHYMEGQAMSDVELAVVPVAGDMTDAMTVPEGEEKEECRYCGGDCPNDEDNACDGYLGDIDGLYAESVEVIEAEERDYICVHAKKGKYECSGTSSYAAAKKAAEHWGLKSTAGIDTHLADKEHTATESIEEAVVTENAERIIKVTNIDYAGPALDKLPTETTLKLNIPYDADEDDIYDMVADELEDRHGVKVSGFDMNFAESVEEDEDIIGNIIGKLGQTKAGQRGGKDVIGDIIAKLPKDSDEKTVNMPSLPKSKPERTPTVSAVAQQAAANKAVRSMAQDTTRPLRQSKFSEWSKK